MYIRISLKHLLSLTSKSFQYILFQAFVYCLICRHELGRRWDTRLERSDTLTVLARATAVDRVCRHQLYICSPQWINTNPTTLLPRDIRHAIVSSLLCANSNPSFLEQFLCLWWVMTFSSAHIFLSGGLLHIGLIGWWPSTLCSASRRRLFVPFLYCLRTFSHRAVSVAGPLFWSIYKSHLTADEI